MGLNPIETVQQLKEKFCFPVKDYYSLLGFDYSQKSYEDIAIEWTSLYNEFSESSTIMDGVGYVIKALNEQGYIQSIVSACENNLLKMKLSSLGLSEFFEKIEGTRDSNAHSKIQIALDWKRHNPDAVAVVIGDTEHDYEVASAIGADCILYSGGFVSEERLQRIGCPVIRDFDEIWDYIK